jgi:DnaK suppressor protein
MKRELMDYFSGVLKRRLMDALPEAETMLPGLLGSSQHREPMDEVDLASHQYEQEFNIRIHRHHQKKVQEIVAAIRRLTDGEYGFCEVCGDEIGVERLKVQPTATVCLTCRRSMEMVSARYRAA